jgi:hypothetical protein
MKSGDEVRRLLDQHGTTYARAADIATASARELFEAGWRTPERCRGQPGSNGSTRWSEVATGATTRPPRHSWRRMPTICCASTAQHVHVDTADERLRMSAARADITDLQLARALLGLLHQPET